MKFSRDLSRYVLFFAIAFALLDLWTTHSTGWSSLARLYSHSGPAPVATVRRHVSFAVNGGAGFEFREMAKVAASPDGLYISVPFFLRFRKPPLLIPWDAVDHFSRTYWTCRRFDTEIHLRDLPISIDVTDDGSRIQQTLVERGIPERSKPGAGCP